MIEFSLKVDYSNQQSAEKAVEHHNNTLLTAMAVAADIAKYTQPGVNSAVVTQCINGNYKVVLFEDGNRCGLVEVRKKDIAQRSSQRDVRDNTPPVPAVIHGQFPHANAFAKRKDGCYTTVYRDTVKGIRYTAISSSGSLLTNNQANGGVLLMTLVSEDGRLWHIPLSEFIEGRYVRVD